MMHAIWLWVIRSVTTPLLDWVIHIHRLGRGRPWAPPRESHSCLMLTYAMALALDAQAGSLSLMVTSASMYR